MSLLRRRIMMTEETGSMMFKENVSIEGSTSSVVVDRKYNTFMIFAQFNGEIPNSNMAIYVAGIYNGEDFVPTSAEVILGNSVNNIRPEDVISVSQESITIKTYPNHFVATGDWTVCQIEIPENYIPTKLN